MRAKRRIGASTHHRVAPSKPSKLFETADEEVRRKGADLGRVHKLLARAHARGDLRATYALGTWHLHGHVLARNLRKGTSMIRRAAQGGIADAEYDLAVSYETGVGVRRNPPLAFRYYLRAALHGDAQAAYEVGRCYFWGIGVARDRPVGRVWSAHGLAGGASASGPATRRTDHG